MSESSFGRMSGNNMGSYFIPLALLCTVQNVDGMICIVVSLTNMGSTYMARSFTKSIMPRAYRPMSRHASPARVAQANTLTIMRVLFAKICDTNSSSSIATVHRNKQALFCFDPRCLYLYSSPGLSFILPMVFLQNSQARYRMRW